MNLENFSNNQLLNLIIMFAVFALGFAGLLVYSITGFGRRGKKHNKKKKEGISFKADLSQGRVGETELKQIVQGTEVNKESKSQEAGSLLKSGGLLKSTPNTERSPSPEEKLPTAASSRQSFAQPNPAASPLSEPQPAPSEPSAFLPAASTARQELLRVLVDRESGEIVVEVDGRQYDNIGQIKERAIGQRILEVVPLLLKFTGGMIATVTGFKTLPVPQAKLTALPPEPQPASPVEAAGPEASSPQGNSFAQPARGARTAQGDAWVQPQEKGRLSSSPYDRPKEASGRKRGRLFGRLSKPDKALETPGFDLASEIDAVLQQNLLAAGIHIPIKIDSGLDGHLRIKVADRFFRAVDEVEPPDIRALIQNSIKEWERR